MDMITLSRISESTSRGSYLRVGEVYVEEASECLPGYLKYIRNDILKPFKVKILRYAERVHEIHNPAKYLPPTSMKR